MKAAITGIALTILGLVIVGMLDGWYDALGVFILLWGNNIDSNFKYQKKHKNA